MNLVLLPYTKSVPLGYFQNFLNESKMWTQFLPENAISSTAPSPIQGHSAIHISGGTRPPQVQFSVDFWLFRFICCEFIARCRSQSRRAIQISGVLVSRAPNTPKYKTRNIGKKSNQSSPTKRALPNVLNFTDWRLPGGAPPGPLWARRHYTCDILVWAWTISPL